MKKYKLYKAMDKSLSVFLLFLKNLYLDKNRIALKENEEKASDFLILFSLAS
jgi:hypothetical protein